MSIWVGVAEPIRVLNGHSDAANYRAEGEPTAYVGVAIAEGYHDHVQLAVWDDAEPQEMEVLLSPAAVRELHRILGSLLGGLDAS